MAVRLGVPIENLTSLPVLLHPDVVEPVIDAYWQKNGDEPKIFTIDLGWKLLRIAREYGADSMVEVDWIEGDAQDLPFEDDSFDRVISCFGQMFAPDQ